VAGKATRKSTRNGKTGRDKARRKPSSRVRSVARQHTKGLPFIQTIAVVLAVLAVAVGYVWQRENIKLRRGAIKDLSYIGAGLVEEIDRLEMEVARLEAPSRIENIAVEQLHMSAPGNWQMIPVQLGVVPGID
jgi:cell division protein FtsL